MDQNKQHASGGFLFGVVVGVVLALLFTTKKGREILRMLTDEGLNKFADLEDMLQEKVHEVHDDSDVENSDYVAPEEREVAPEPAPQPKSSHKEVLSTEEKTQTHVSEEPVHEASESKHPPKRFFRKAK